MSPDFVIDDEEEKSDTHELCQDPSAIGQAETLLGCTIDQPGQGDGSDSCDAVQAHGDRGSARPKPAKSSDSGALPDRTWSSKMQLELFRHNAKKIAEEYIKEKGTKLSKDRSRSHAVKDYDAYEQGQRDGKKIDVHRRRIKEAEVVDLAVAELSS